MADNSCGLYGPCIASASLSSCKHVASSVTTLVVLETAGRDMVPFACDESVPLSIIAVNTPKSVTGDDFFVSRQEG